MNKTVDLGAWAVGGNDVIYGGLGDDFLHGGAGNDAILGAEAQPAFFSDGVPPATPITYDPATRKLQYYDANNALRCIDGFFLNFDAADAAGNKISDGKDRLFGDLGHDWLVGGTQNDRLFGGAGDDVHDADDNHDTNGGLNNAPDASAYADGDFAYGGDGLDVLIANTGADRLFDWSGEFNTYLAPFKPNGLPTVVRSPSPSIQQFLLDLGRESGADRSLTEPDGELGLFTSADPQWQQNKGGPRDPQPGNASGSRDTVGGPEDDRGTALPLPGSLEAVTLGAGARALSGDGLQSILAEAARRWSLVGLQASYAGMMLDIVDLPGLALARYTGPSIELDVDAAGHGWFVDGTPRDDGEFARRGGGLSARAGSAADGRMDLLSVVAHELGHALGLEHADDGVMCERLDAGERVLPTAASGLRATLAAGLSGEALPYLAAGAMRAPNATLPASAPVIDWSGRTPGAQLGLHSPRGAERDQPAWVDDFVSNTGRNEAERNPNAKLRLSLPAAAKTRLLGRGG